MTYKASHNEHPWVSHVQGFRCKQEEKIACIINANKLKFRYLNGHKLLQCVLKTHMMSMSVPISLYFELTCSSAYPQKTYSTLLQHKLCQASLVACHIKNKFKDLTFKSAGIWNLQIFESAPIFDFSMPHEGWPSLTSPGTDISQYSDISSKILKSVIRFGRKTKWVAPVPCAYNRGYNPGLFLTRGAAWKQAIDECVWRISQKVYHQCWIVQAFLHLSHCQAFYCYFRLLMIRY